MMKNWKTKTMIAKRQKVRRRISLFSKQKDENDTRDKIDPYQTNNKYLLQL